MRCTPEAYQEVQLLTALNEGELQARIQAATVKLVAPGFSGCGVICKVEQDAFLKDRAMIVTSKNNLLRHAKWDPKETPPDFGDYAIKDLLNKFIDKVKMGYGEDDLAEFSDIAIFETNWSHDLMLLLSSDEALIAHTRRFGMYASLSRIQNHRIYYSGSIEKPFRQLQTGFGWSEGSAGTPGETPVYRLTEFCSETPISVKQNRTAEGSYHQVVCLNADEDNTLTIGDEGGGLFAAYAAKDEAPELYLQGVNLGANYYPGILPEEDAITNNAATLAQAIIERTYVQLDH